MGSRPAPRGQAPWRRALRSHGGRADHRRSCPNLANCAQHDIGHGRLRPTALLWTEAGEIRLRGLAVDAALFGPIDPAAPDADVDGLGCLLYAMTTGRWPALGIDSSLVHIPLAPAAGRTVPMPSRVRAGMPSESDDLVTRSVRQVALPRGLMPITSINAFTSLAGSAEDYLSPVPGLHRPALVVVCAPPPLLPRPPSPQLYQIHGHGSDLPRRRQFLRLTGRMTAVAFAVALSAGIAWFSGSRLSGAGGGGTGCRCRLIHSRDRCCPFVEEFDSGLTAVLPIEDVRRTTRSVTTTTTDNPTASTRRRRQACQVKADADGTTSWLTRNTTPPSGDKGVELIVDLGTPNSYRQLIGPGRIWNRH